MPDTPPRVIGVIPTGWVSSCVSLSLRFVVVVFSFSLGLLGSSATVKKPAKHETHSAIFRVPYSIHSSYSEILELIRAVRPCRVVPIVPDSPCPYEVIAPLLSGDEPRVPEMPALVGNENRAVEAAVSFFYIPTRNCS